MDAMRFSPFLVVILACGGSTSPETSAEPSEPSAQSTSGDDAPGPDTPLGLMNGAQPAEGLYTAGQPTVEALDAAHASGVRTVISLRAEDEPGQEEEGEAVERLGLRFERLVVRGADGVTADNARRLDELLGEASNHGDTLLHCGSSNRVGALMALRAFFVLDATLDAAIEQGRAAGLAGLEVRVREVLEQACDDAPDDARCPREFMREGGPAFR